MSGGNIVLGGDNGLPYGRFVLLNCTNLLLPDSNWTPVVTNQFDAQGTFRLTNTAASVISPTFYRLQLH